jgi:hypothetical protein
MKIKKIIFLFAIAFFVSSCDIETKQMNEHLLNIYSETQLADLPRYDWRVRHFFENDEFEYYIVDYQKRDTSFKFEFKYYKTLDKYKIEEYYKSYLNKNDGVYYSLFWCYDTLYFYKNIDTIGLHKEFIVGKYNYMYKNNQFTPCQEKYFEQHKDSLTRVIGDTLSKLPEL